MKVYNTKREGRIGFKLMFPTIEYLKDKLYLPPRSREEALHNQKINKEIKCLNHTEQE